MSKRVVAVHISGHEYRIRSDADEAALQHVAGLVDKAMKRVAERTGTVDTLDTAILTSLNLAREVVGLRQRVAEPDSAEADATRLRGLIELAESALVGDLGDSELTPLLMVPAGSDLEGAESDLLGPLIDGSAVESKAAPG